MKNYLSDLKEDLKAEFYNVIGFANDWLLNVGIVGQIAYFQIYIMWWVS